MAWGGGLEGGGDCSPLAAAAAAFPEEEIGDPGAESHKVPF